MTELTVAPAPTPPARTSRTAPELLVPSVLGGNKGTVCAGETRARSAAGGRGRRVYPRTVSAGGTGRPGAFGGRGTPSSESPAVQAGRAAGRRGAGGGRGTPGRGRGLGAWPRAGAWHRPGVPAGARRGPRSLHPVARPQPAGAGRAPRAPRGWVFLFLFFFIWSNSHVNRPPFTCAPIGRRGRIPRGATPPRRCLTCRA